MPCYRLIGFQLLLFHTVVAIIHVMLVGKERKHEEKIERKTMKTIKNFKKQIVSSGKRNRFGQRFTVLYEMSSEKEKKRNRAQK